MSGDVTQQPEPEPSSLGTGISAELAHFATKEEVLHNPGTKNETTIQEGDYCNECGSSPHEVDYCPRSR